MVSTPINVQSLLNVPVPIANNSILGTLSASTPPMSSNTMGYIPSFQPSTPYSATNLPEFMKGYQQTPSGRFVMSQGLLGVAPTIDKVQSLFSKGYASEYGPLEQKFQESFALDPSWFGNIYRAGGLIPRTFTGTTEDSSSGLAGDIAVGLALKEAYPYAEDLLNVVTDPLSEKVKNIEESLGEKFEEKVTQPVKETVIEPIKTGFEEYVTEPVKETVIDPVVEAYKESALKKDIVDPLVDEVQQFGKKLDETFDKPEFINIAQEKAKEYIKEFKESDIYKAGETAIDIGTDALKAYGNIENVIKDPNPMNAFKAIDAMDKLTTYLPEDAQKSLQEITADIGPITGVVLDGLAVASIANAFEDPSVENLANAYGSVDYLATQGAFGTDLSTGLPGAENIAGIGTIVGGLKALEGGIDSPGEALQVATGAATAASMFGGGTAIGSAGAAALPVLGPVAALYGAFEILNKPEANLGHAVVGRDDYGGYSIESEGYKGEGENITKPEASAAMLVLGELERNYGYKFDADAWEKVNKRVDFDNGKWVRGAHDVIIDALQQGALIPTENTPQGLDFGSMLKDARFYMSEAPYTTNKSMSSYARGQERAKQLQESEAYGPEGPHPLEVERMKMGLDPFQWSADISEQFGRLDLSGLDFSGLNIPQVASDYQPAPEPEYYTVDGQQYTPAQLQNIFGGGISIPSPFAGFTAPQYG